VTALHAAAVQVGLMECEYCVVGGGIVGLATAVALLEQRPGASLILLEKEDELAHHQTGHNSGVIHAGVYYTPGSLKARLCREGNEETRSFCRAEKIPHEVCGKLIVATNPVEAKRLESLRARCMQNEIEAELLDQTELRRVEPRIAGFSALLIPTSGIVNYTQVSQALGRRLHALGGLICLGSGVTAIRESSSTVLVSTAARSAIHCKKLIACAGLQADRLARLAGLFPKVRIVPFRGEYFRLPAAKNTIVRHLIYPVPDPALPFLGVHLTRMIDGTVTVGPNAVLGFAREGYRRASFSLQDASDMVTYGGFWRLLRRHWRSALQEGKGSLLRGHYLEGCRRYCPELTISDLGPYPAGIRAQAVDGAGELIHDFLFVETPRMIHVLNAPSPAATAAIPIGRMIAKRTI
jgi:L-2-hydroxyglutarate oxidase